MINIENETFYIDCKFKISEAGLNFIWVETKMFGTK